ncbi:NAD(P)/FAD-dependent oxidoreductase [Candidatus Amoebophilus asiaticus]|nr:FAD-dependent oxidoreductase [Candidatus Amoebophilus asiaticus]
MFDYIIVGQGLAGTALAWQLLKAGKQVLVINNQYTNQSSQVAAGIYNPITGRNLVKTWLADELFPALVQFYESISAELSIKLLYPMPIFRPFLDNQESIMWRKRALEDRYKPFWEEAIGDYQEADIFNQYGGFIIKQAGYVDVPCFLAATRTYLQSKNCYIEADFDYERLQLLSEGSVNYQGIQANKIIFCEGPQVALNPFFNYLPFRFAKGELLKVQLSKPIKVIYNRRVFILPRTRDQAFVGASYEWEDLTLHPTEKARQELEDKLRQLTRLPYSVFGQQVGIRPATVDRRPYAGLHPQYPQLGIFNGLGSKGISLAPYLAGEFVEYLLYGKSLPVEVRLDRVGGIGTC